MNKLFNFMVLTIMSITFNSCSSDENSTTEDYTSRSKIEALNSFDHSFKDNFDYLASTRSSITTASENTSDSIFALVGRKICTTLRPATEDILIKFGVTDQILHEVYNENKYKFQGETTFDEFKCFTALTIYDTYKSSKKTEPMTRVSWNNIHKANALDIAVCIGTGVSIKQLFDLPGRKIAQFAVKKLASRLIPYVGWGWGIASAAYCISKL